MTAILTKLLISLLVRLASGWLEKNLPDAKGPFLDLADRLGKSGKTTKKCHRVICRLRRKHVEPKGQGK